MIVPRVPIFNYLCKKFYTHMQKMNQTNIGGGGAKIMPRFTHKKQQQKN